MLKNVFAKFVVKNVVVLQKFAVKSVVIPQKFVAFFVVACHTIPNKLAEVLVCIEQLLKSS